MHLHVHLLLVTALTSFLLPPVQGYQCAICPPLEDGSLPKKRPCFLFNVVLTDAKKLIVTVEPGMGERATIADFMDDNDKSTISKECDPKTAEALSNLSKLLPVAESSSFLGGLMEASTPLIRFFIMFLIAYFILRSSLKSLDPTYERKQKAKVKAKDLMKRLGLKDLSLNEYELLIASHLIDPSDLTTSWGDIAGLEGVIQEIKRRVISPILATRANVQLSSRLIQPTKGVLLFGVPGCGKTLLAKAMAKEAQCSFINLDVSALTDKYYGETDKLTAALFSLAEKIQPCIIFIDEIDSLLRSRQTSDHEVTSHIKTQFMSHWDGLITDPSKTVIILGATNRPRDVDPAILRRMSVQFHIPSPELFQRKRILDLILANEEIAPDFDLDAVATMTDGFSGSDLKEVAQSAAIAALGDVNLGGGDGCGGPNISRPWLNFRNLLLTRAKAVSTTQPRRTVILRPLRMQDFERAINKLKESRNQTGNPVPGSNIHRIIRNMQDFNNNFN